MMKIDNNDPIPNKLQNTVHKFKILGLSYLQSTSFNEIAVLIIGNISFYKMGIFSHNHV